MSERVIDSVCPHCGRLGTTVRVVKHEDGFTKLGRLCKECGGEWIHTFDADWLAVAKMRRLEAEVERLREALIEWDALIQHQYSGSRDAMTDMQYAIFRTRQILDELDAPKALEAKP